MEKLLLLDSNSLLHRAYYALPGLTDSKGNPTGAIFGFVSMLARLIKEEKPTHIAAAFDLKVPKKKARYRRPGKCLRRKLAIDDREKVPKKKARYRRTDHPTLRLCIARSTRLTSMTGQTPTPSPPGPMCSQTGRDKGEIMISEGKRSGKCATSCLAKASASARSWE